MVTGSPHSHSKRTDDMLETLMLHHEYCRNHKVRRVPMWELHACPFCASALKLDLNPIYKHEGGYCLGDCWTLVNYLLTRSAAGKFPAVVSRGFEPKPESMYVAYDLMERIAALMDSTGSFVFTHSEGTTITDQSKIWGPPHGDPRLPLKAQHRWDGGSSGRIALQLDGRSGAVAKNPPAADLARFHALPKTVAMGLPMTLEESIAVMRTCRFMIGVCSGMSHVAHAVGIPLIIVQYHQPVSSWHPLPTSSTPWRFATGTDQALAFAQDWLAKP